MSIVVRGYGLGLDSSSSIVAYGFAGRDQDVVEPEQALDSFTVDQAFVVEYSGQRRQPTKEEWIRWKKWVHYIQHGGLSIKIRKRGGETVWLVERNTETAAYAKHQKLAKRMTKGIKRA